MVRGTVDKMDDPTSLNTYIDVKNTCKQYSLKMNNCLLSLSDVTMSASNG